MSIRMKLQEICESTNAIEELALFLSASSESIRSETIGLILRNDEFVDLQSATLRLPQYHTSATSEDARRLVEQSQDDRVLYLALTTLARDVNADYRSLLVRYACEPDEQLAVASTKVLSSFPQELAVELLAKVYSESANSQAVYAAAIYLGYLGYDEVVSFLERKVAWTDGNSNDQIGAICALANLNHALARQRLRDLLQARTPTQVSIVCACLSRISIFAGVTTNEELITLALDWLSPRDKSKGINQRG